MISVREDRVRAAANAASNATGGSGVRINDWDERPVWGASKSEPNWKGGMLGGTTDWFSAGSGTIN